MYSNYRVFLNKLGFTGKQPIWNNYCTLKWCFFFSLHLKRHSHVLGVEIAKIATHLPTLGPHIILNNIISQNCMYCIMRFFNLVFSWINSTWTLIATHLPTLGSHVILYEYNKSKLHVLYNEIFWTWFFHESIVHGP